MLSASGLARRVRRFVSSNPAKAGALAGALVGAYFGSSIGIAAMGTAISGTFPGLAVGGAFGALIVSTLQKKKRVPPEAKSPREIEEELLSQGYKVIESNGEKHFLKRIYD